MVTHCLGLVSLGALLLCAPLNAQQNPQSSAAAKPAATVVNLNAATAAELEALPGIGAKTAALILAYRQKNGSFKKIEELMNVKGIGEKSFLRIKPLVMVTPSKVDGEARPATNPAR